MKINAYLEITMKIDNENRPAAAKVYTDYRGPFLNTIPGALSKDLLIRDEDVQVLHGFASVEDARAYLQSDMFQKDVFVGLKPLWSADPEGTFFCGGNKSQIFRRRRTYQCRIFDFCCLVTNVPGLTDLKNILA